MITNEEKIISEKEKLFELKDSLLKYKKMKPSQEKVWEKFYPEDARNFDYPKMKAYDLVYEENKDRKDNIALEYEGSEITYGDFFDKVEERTDYFKSKGVKEKDVVTVSMLMSPDFVYDWYALGRLNAVTNLIDPRTSCAGIQKYLEEADSSIILNTDVFLPKIIKAMKSDSYNVINHSLRNEAKNMPFVLGILSRIMGDYGMFLSCFDKRIENFHNQEMHNTEKSLPDYYENMPLTVVHTGGTTGFPKGVLLSHDNYNAMAYEYMKSQIGFTEKDKFLMIMPPWISYGSGMLHMSLVTGMQATIISKPDSKKMPNYIMKYQPQWFAGVPAHFKIISESDIIKNNDISFLKAGAVGGASMSAKLYDECSELFMKQGAQKGVYPGYALTESTSAFAVRQLENYKSGSVGIPLPGCTVGIFKYDDILEETTEEELDYSQIGEICLQTPNQMLGYFKNEELTDLVLRKHSDGNVWVHTGDLGYIDEEGSIFIEGRIKELITRYDGFKIYPSWVEKEIISNDNVVDCKVVAVNDKKHGYGQVPKAFIVLKNQSLKKETLKDVYNKCKRELPEYYVENCQFETIDALPLTALGKVDYRALQEDNDSKVLKR